MLHYNQLAREKSFLGLFKALVMLQTYFASSIRDFAESRGDIKPTSILTEILFDLASLGQKTYLGGKAVVMIPSVRYQGDAFYTIGLEDFTERITTVPFFPELILSPA